jgi:endoglucanase
MKSNGRLIKIICCMLCACLLSSCSFPDINLNRASDTKSQPDITSLGLKPDFTYDVPVSRPHIEVDRLGYLPGEQKKAVFIGKDLNGRFSLVDADTGNTVYTGVLKKSKSAGTGGTQTYTGDFSSWKKTGSYYLETDVIGRSYTFSIKKDLYDGLFRSAVKQYYLSRCGMSLTDQYAGKNAHGACHTRSAYLQGEPDVELDVQGGWHVDGLGNRDVVQGCQAADMLLLTYELNSDVCGDDVGIPESGNKIPDILDEVKYETDWLLKMQDDKSGGAYSGVTVTGSAAAQTLVAGRITMDATLEFAAAMAKFSYVYQAYDTDYATVCLKAADRAMKCARQYASDTDPAKVFMAAAELYRATGYDQYRQDVMEYLSTVDEPDMSNVSVFRGCVTYLCTRQQVDVDLCDKVITGLMDEATDVSEDARHAEYLVQEHTGSDKNEKMLELTSHLAVVNYVITNHEYETLLEDYAHYFMGRNSSAACYADCDGIAADAPDDQKINSRIGQNAYWVLLVSELEEAEKTSGTASEDKGAQ